MKKKKSSMISLNRKPMTAKVLIASHGLGEGHKTFGDILYRTLSQIPHFNVEHRTFSGGAPNRFYRMASKHFPLWLDLTWWIEELPGFDVFEFLLNIRFLRLAFSILRTDHPDFVITTRFSLSLVFSFARSISKSRTKIVNAIPDAGPPRRLGWHGRGGLRAHGQRQVSCVPAPRRAALCRWCICWR